MSRITTLVLGKDAPAQCDDCGWTGPASQCEAGISDLDDRIAPGVTVPVGECPHCGALAHYVGATAPKWSVERRLYEAARRLHDLENRAVRPNKGRNLDDALEDWQVHPAGMWENDQGPAGWCAVSNADEGIVAYFLDEAAACRYRIAMVNRDLNP